jgi:protein TonB
VRRFEGGETFHSHPIFISGIYLVIVSRFLLRALRSSRSFTVEKRDAQRKIDWAPFYADGGAENFCQGASPEYPSRARRDWSLGVVRARLFVTDGKVDDVAILSGPRVFHPAVESAVRGYQCRRYPFTVEMDREFVFSLN